VALLHAAWTTLLLCHPHDTLCGCSTDEVARAMDARVDDVMSQAEGLRRDALMTLLGHDEADARAHPESWLPSVIVQNAAARARGGVAEVELLLFVAAAPVGPGSATSGGAVRAAAGTGGKPTSLGGGTVPLQLLDRALAYHRIESPRRYPRNDAVERVRAVAWLPPIDGYSVRALALDATDRAHVARDATSGPPVPVVVSDNRMRNDFLDVRVATDGRVHVSTSDGAFEVDSLIGFEDVGDAGDLYTHSPIGKPVTSAWFAGARTVHRGPLRGELEARWRMRIPAKARLAEQPLERPAARGGRHVEIEIVVRLTLDAGAPCVRVSVQGENRAHDHRLRIVFRTGLVDAFVHADAAFGVVPRVALVVPADEQSAERVPRTAPLHRYVSLFGNDRGVTLFSDGLAEYEATAGGEVAITLVRAVGELSRADLPERPGHAGWPVSTPEAQSAGDFAASFALLPHGPRSVRAAAIIEAAADDVLLPLRGDTLRSSLATEDASNFVRLEGDGLACTAVKPAERGGWVALRCVNLTDHEIAGRWVLGAPIVEARLARLDETPLSALAIDAGAIAFTVSPRAIVTVLVR